MIGQNLIVRSDNRLNPCYHPYHPYHCPSLPSGHSYLHIGGLILCSMCEHRCVVVGFILPLLEKFFFLKKEPNYTTPPTYTHTYTPTYADIPMPGGRAHRVILVIMVISHSSQSFQSNLSRILSIFIQIMIIK